MSLSNIEGKLSRAEMKKIMAGSGTGTCTVTTNCVNAPAATKSNLMRSGSISCSGKKCSRTALSVTCDDVTTWC